MSTTPTAIDPILGFIRVDHGVLVAKSADGRQTITVTVDTATDGHEKLHLEVDGFHGGACSDALDALQAKLDATGVRLLKSLTQKDGSDPLHSTTQTHS